MDPYEFLKNATRQVPVLKYAIGIVGIAAAIKLTQTFIPDTTVALPAIILMLALMVLLMLVAKLDKITPNKSFLLPARIVLWTVTLVFALSLSLLFSSYFLSWPKPFKQIIYQNERGFYAFGGIFPQDFNFDDIVKQNLAPNKELDLLLSKQVNKQSKTIRVGIPDFKIEGNNTDSSVGGVVADILRDYLTQNSEHVSIAGRESLTLLNELSFDESQAPSVQSIVQAAIPTGADIVISGTLSFVGANAFIVKALAIEVPSGQQLAFQRCEKNGALGYLELVTQCLGPALEEMTPKVFSKISENRRTTPSDEFSLTEYQRIAIANARQLQSLGQLQEAQALYSEVLTIPSADWQAEIDYVRLMSDLGAKEWVSQRTTKLLERIQNTQTDLCYQSMLLNVQAEYSSLATSETVRRAVIKANACGDDAIIAEALFNYASYFDKTDLSLTRAAIHRAKSLLDDRNEHYAWLKCELDHYEYVVLNENELNWQGDRPQNFFALAEQCSEAGNYRIASLAYRNAGITAWSAELSHESLQQAVDLSTKIGGTSLDTSLLKLAESQRSKGQYLAADDTLVSMLQRHIGAIYSITGKLPEEINTLDNDLIARLDLPSVAANNTPTSQDLINYHLKGTARALAAWSKRTEHYSSNQANAYFSVAQKLDPSLENTPKTSSNKLDESLLRINLVLDDIYQALSKPLRSQDLDLHQAFDLVIASTKTSAFLKLSFQEQNKRLEIAEKLATWRDSDKDIVETHIQRAKLLTKLGQADRSLNLLASTATKIIDQPQLSKRIEQAKIDNYANDNSEALIASRQRQVEFAEQYSAHEYMRMLYWLQRDLWLNTDKSASMIVQDYQSNIVDVLKKESTTAGIYGIELLAELINLMSNAHGSQNAVDLYKLRIKLIHPINDEIGNALAKADLVSQISYYLFHKVRGGMPKAIVKNTEVIRLMQDITSKVHALAKQGLNEDAVRIILRLPPEAPEMKTLYEFARQWIEAIKGTDEYYALASTLYLESGRLAENFPLKKSMFDIAFNKASEGKLLSSQVAAKAALIDAEVTAELSFSTTFEQCMQLSSKGTHQHRCAMGIWFALVNEQVNVFDDKSALESWYNASLSIKNTSEYRYFTPKKQSDLLSLLATFAIALDKEAEFDAYHQEIANHFNGDKPDPYQWASYLSRVASLISTENPSLSLGMYKEFIASNGASDYWLSGTHTRIARLAYSLQDYDTYERSLSEGTQLALEYDEERVPYYHLLKLLPAFDQQDWASVSDVYQQASNSVNTHKPASVHWARELQFMSAVAKILGQDYDQGLAILAPQIEYAVTDAEQDSAQKPCYHAGVLKLTKVAKLAIGRCDKLGDIDEHVDKLLSQCTEKSVDEYWTDGPAYADWEIPNTCKQAASELSFLLGYRN